MASPDRVSSVSVPHPDGIKPPPKENARTVLPNDCCISPLAPVSPPEALITVVPSTSNCHPPIFSGDL